MNQQPTQQELKIQALLQRIAELTAEYENKVADLRVHLTVVSEELKEVKTKNEELASGNSDTGTPVSSDE